MAATAQHTRRGKQPRRSGTKYMTMRDLAEQTGFHYRTIKRMVHDDLIPHETFGNAVLIPISKIRQMLSEVA